MKWEGQSGSGVCVYTCSPACVRENKEKALYLGLYILCNISDVSNSPQESFCSYPFLIKAINIEVISYSWVIY